MGGIVGLDPEQTEQIRKARALLSNPELLGKYYSVERGTGRLIPRYELSDRRYLRMIHKARMEGRALMAADIERIMDAHKNAALFYRGTRIARTETIGALNAGRYEAAQQLGETAGLRADQIELVWDATGDSRTRDSHASMDGQRVRQGEDFVTPDGHRLKYPGDRSGDAPASEVIQCRCVARISVDFIKGLK